MIFKSYSSVVKYSMEAFFTFSFFIHLAKFIWDRMELEPWFWCSVSSLAVVYHFVKLLIYSSLLPASPWSASQWIQKLWVHTHTRLITIRGNLEWSVHLPARLWDVQRTCTENIWMSTQILPLLSIEPWGIKAVLCKFCKVFVGILACLLTCHIS